MGEDSGIIGRMGVTHYLMLSNIAVFAGIPAYLLLTTDASGMDAVTSQMTAIYEQYHLTYEAVMERGEYHLLITSGFLHGSLLHLASNMVGLYLLGKLCEEVYGGLLTGVIYFLSMVTGGLLFIQFIEEPAVGASGAVFGLAGAAILGAPTKSVLSEVPLLQYLSYIPLVRNLFSAVFIGTAFLVIPELLALAGIMESMENVAHIAHAGGALGGALIAMLTRTKQARVGVWFFLFFGGAAAAFFALPQGSDMQMAAGAGLLGGALLLRFLYWILS